MQQLKDFHSPFNLYDFFGYLLPGFFLVALYVVEFDLVLLLSYVEKYNPCPRDLEHAELELRLAYIKGFLTNFSEEYKLIPFTCFILFCYLLGHIIAAFSSMFIERQFVKKLLGLPADNLFRDDHFVRIRFFFGNYRRPFRQNFQVEFARAAVRAFGYRVGPEDYYWLCYVYIHRQAPELFARLQHFVNLYSFMRNVCATFIFYFLLRLPFLVFLPPEKKGLTFLIHAVFAGVAFMLFWSYLKFFKRQAVDLFYSFFVLTAVEKSTNT